MFLDRFRQQIDNAEKRFRENRDQRTEREKELRKIDEGRLDEVDLACLDEQARFSRRIALSALAAEGVVRRAMASAAPVADTRAVLLERIIKTNELMSSTFLIEGARVRRSVGRVVIRGSSGGVLGFGTGSMVSPRLMMTNNHVLESSGTAGNSSIQFDFVDLFDGSRMEVVEFELTPSEFFETDETLDYSLVAVSMTGTRGQNLAARGWTPFIPESGKAVVGERVNIIQHPGGEVQQIALRQNRIVDVAGDFLHYSTDTRRGSSGSPVANDAWQTAALHHAGVPRRDDQGRILLLSGRPWDGSQGTIGQIDWMANEGARISKLVENLKSLEPGMSPSRRDLLAQAFSPPPPVRERADGPPAHASSPTTRIDDEGRVVYTVPVEITVGIPCSLRESSDTTQPPDPATSVPSRSEAPSRIDEGDLQAAQAALRAHESEAYYDEEADGAEAAAYYAGIAEDAGLVGRPLFAALHQLLKETHTTVLSYKTARLEHLYPWVDLHPDQSLKSIYSGEGFSADEVIRRDLEVQALRESMLSKFMATESAHDPESLEAFLEVLEASSPFNCEHVVPQSWFAKRQPMKADLHHLFTCESDCNSFRSNIPYFDFPPEHEAVRQKCGRRETNDRFEPAAGKGPAARATLYFLIRYVGLVGDETRELQTDRLPTLLKWHSEEPVTDYERHRNAAIHAAQGNRNPLIDFPEWADHIEFAAGFGE